MIRYKTTRSHHPSPFITFFFFFNDTATTEIYPLSLHDALPICQQIRQCRKVGDVPVARLVLRRERDGQDLGHVAARSEEHTSELQSPCNLVCRLLLEKKKRSTCT